jgi:hypothetical protein
MIAWWFGTISKVAAERLVLEAISATMATVSVRPAHIVGDALEDDLYFLSGVQACFSKELSLPSLDVSSGCGNWLLISSMSDVVQRPSKPRRWFSKPDMLVLDRKALGIFNERPNTGSDMRGSLTTWRLRGL